MTCPRCSVAEISPLTGRCELCGYSPDGGVTVQDPVDEATDVLARRELAGEFHVDAPLSLSSTRALYVAREVSSNQHLFLTALRKVEPRQPLMDEQFRRAAELAQTLEHPHIVPVARFGITEGLYWYATEHVRSRSLRLILATRGPLDVRSAVRIVAQVASGLDYAHRRGLVHGDLRPETVLIDADGWVRLCDVLVARACEAPAAPAAAPAPRPAHIAPEDHSAGQRSPAADQYALAVLIHECLTGVPPMEHEPLETARPELPVHVAHAVRRALSPSPADRYPSVLDFVAALESPGRLSLAGARPSGKASSIVLTIPDWKPPPTERNWRLVAWGLGLVAVIALGALAVPRITRLRQQPYYDAPAARPAPASVAPRSDTAVLAPAERVTTRAAPSPAPPSDQRPARRVTEQRSTGERATRPAPVPPAPAAAAEPGRLFVSATPWGRLFIDGEPAGNTPKANLSVAAGTHTIRVEREGFETVERTIAVSPGQVVRITDIVLAERRP